MYLCVCERTTLLTSPGFWYAGTLVARGEMKAGDALAVFFAVVMGAMGLGQAYALADVRCGC